MSPTNLLKMVADLDQAREKTALLQELDTLRNAITISDDTDPIAPPVELSANNVEFSHVSAKDHHLPKTDADLAAEADSTTIKTSVWWDIENCHVPKGCDANQVAQNIRSALLEKKIPGSLIIYAYGDTSLIPNSVQQALSSTGVSLNHVPAGVKDGSDKKMLVDMMLWAMENQAPANVMLISGDRDFSYVLHQLGMKRYNILLARPEKASEPLIAAAKTVWLWPNLVIGDQHPVLLKQAHQPSMQMDSGLVRGTKRNRSFCELCNVVCPNHCFSAHLSGKRHKARHGAQIMREAREILRISNLTRPKSVWCGICEISFESQARYETHLRILGEEHQNNFEDQAEHSSNRT